MNQVPSVKYWNLNPLEKESNVVVESYKNPSGNNVQVYRILLSSSSSSSNQHSLDKYLNSLS